MGNASLGTSTGYKSCSRYVGLPEIVIFGISIGLPRVSNIASVMGQTWHCEGSFKFDIEMTKQGTCRVFRQFERLAELCDANLKYIPLTFMLGFFVTIVVDRWRNIFQNMGWIENLALTVAALLRGNSKQALLYRRSIIRYTVLSQVRLLLLIHISCFKYYPVLMGIRIAFLVFNRSIRI
ncbi:hypothetical protein ANCDUO_16743 [Ancylostoma duodenale]|uniref:Bestrophin homolog n=1 Tax=Ancylostoma duodenale TaxID=51022 RepID=A0A0C2CA16_9BILA|nr:hypothetical protein ANCDUO_16743 [Ancylostoma duodenale]